MALLSTNMQRNVLSVAAAMTLTLSSTNALAAHGVSYPYLGGTGYWTSNSADNTVTFTSTSYWQQSELVKSIGVSLPSVGDAPPTPPPHGSSGDGLGGLDYTLSQVVTAVNQNEGYYEVTHTFTHSYSSFNTFNGRFYDSVSGAGSRLDHSRFAGAFTLNLDGSGNDSARITEYSPFVDFAVGATQSFQLSATDPEGDQVTWSLAPVSDSHIVIPSIGSNVVSVNSSGLLTWDTTGGTVGSLHSVQAFATDSNGNQTFQEFVIRLTEGSSTPSPVPEPAPLALLGAGLIGLILSKRRLNGSAVNE